MGARINKAFQTDKEPKRNQRDAFIYSGPLLDDEVRRSQDQKISFPIYVSVCIQVTVCTCACW